MSYFLAVQCTHQHENSTPLQNYISYHVVTNKYYFVGWCLHITHTVCTMSNTVNKVLSIIFFLPDLSHKTKIYFFPSAFFQSCENIFLISQCPIQQIFDCIPWPEKIYINKALMKNKLFFVHLLTFCGFGRTGDSDLRLL
jgi:hypothetical protein